MEDAILKIFFVIFNLEAGFKNMKRVLIFACEFSYFEYIFYHIYPS